MGLITTGPGSPLAFSSASGGKLYAYNDINEFGGTPIAPANTQRQKITFHNPGTKDIFVSPQFSLNTGSNVNLNVGPGRLGGTFRIYGNGGTLVIDGECQQAWNAFCDTGSGGGNPLTVMDSNT